MPWTTGSILKEHIKLECITVITFIDISSASAVTIQRLVSQMVTPLTVLPLQLREAQPCIVAKSNTDVFPEVFFTKALTKALSLNALEGSSGHAHDRLMAQIDKKPVFNSSQKKNHIHITISLCLNRLMENTSFFIAFKAVHRKELGIL